MKNNTPRAVQNPEENINHFPLDEIVRRGAKKMLEQALEIEVDSFLERHQYVLDDEGRRLIVRNGYAKKRKIVTGAGQLDIQTPRVDDRALKRRPIQVQPHSTVSAPLKENRRSSSLALS